MGELAAFEDFEVIPTDHARLWWQRGLHAASRATCLPPLALGLYWFRCERKQRLCGCVQGLQTMSLHTA